MRRGYSFYKYFLKKPNSNFAVCCYRKMGALESHIKRQRLKTHQSCQKHIKVPNIMFERSAVTIGSKLTYMASIGMIKSRYYERCHTSSLVNTQTRRRPI